MEHRSTVALAGAAALLAAALLTGCTGHTNIVLYNGSDPAQSSVPDDPKPSAPPGEAHPAAIDASKGAPEVHRDGELPADKRASAKAQTFNGTVTYPDGVAVSVTSGSRATITAEGSGIITGAPYITLKLKLVNGTQKPLDLSSVVVTLKYGDNVVAAPVYNGATVSDLTGSLKAGGTTTAAYAFQIPKTTSDASLYVDLDGAHTPATFSGTLPR